MGFRPLARKVRRPQAPPSTTTPVADIRSAPSVSAFSYPTTIMAPKPVRTFRKGYVAVVGAPLLIPSATSVSFMSPSVKQWWNHVMRDVEFTIINAQPKDLGVDSEVLVRTLPGRLVWRLIDTVDSPFEVSLLNYAEKIIVPSYELEFRIAGVRVPIVVGSVDSDFSFAPPETIFVWCQMHARCGIAEYVNHPPSRLC